MSYQREKKGACTLSLRNREREKILERRKLTKHARLERQTAAAFDRSGTPLKRTALPLLGLITLRAPPSVSPVQAQYYGWL